MKTFKIFIATLIFSGSIIALNPSQASAFRVRTVPSSTDQKKKECQKTTPVKQPTVSTANTQKNNNQTKILKATLWIGNGGTPK